MLNKIRFWLVKVTLRFYGVKLNPQNITSYFYEFNDIFLNKIYDFGIDAKSKYIIDGGSYIGMSVIKFAKLSPICHILAFEPDKRNYKILVNNIKENGFKNIKVVNALLGGRQDSVDFGSEDDDGSSLFSKNKNYKVRMVRLSEYINRKVDLLKLNIEGSEWEVVNEIKNKLDMVDNIVIEYHCFSDFEQTLHKILAVLSDGGFKYYVSQVPSCRFKKPPIISGKYKYFNLIYATKNKKNN